MQVALQSFLQEFVPDTRVLQLKGRCEMLFLQISLAYQVQTKMDSTERCGMVSYLLNAIPVHHYGRPSTQSGSSIDDYPYTAGFIQFANTGSVPVYTPATMFTYQEVLC
jgi:hypothetical protein